MAARPVSPSSMVEWLLKNWGAKVEQSPSAVQAAIPVA
jgi:hypothetical protein